MKHLNIIKLTALCMPLFLASCASKKNLEVPKDSVKQETVVSSKDNTQQSEAITKLSFVQKVSDSQVYAQNITGSISFNLQAGSKDITLPGSLSMRKDEVIRIQLNVPLLGFEIGRLEFTPDYVLIVDRTHKQYIKEDYNQVSFLKKQGITFYSLQAIFWNQLLLPGKQNVTETDLKKFDADLTGTAQSVPVTYKDGNMTYQWQADRISGRITEVHVSYASSQYGKSTLNMKYGDFKSVGVKMFPATQNLTLSTAATSKVQEAKVNIEMNEVKTDSKWEALTKVPSKYAKVKAEEILKQLIIL